MNEISPAVLVFAGPNGSGKSTITKGFDTIGEYINADDIKKAERCSDMEAAKRATAMREEAVGDRRDFTFETVLSSLRNVELLKKAKRYGYWVEVVFVLTADVEINIARVKQRVEKGGHDVPEDKIRSRYYKSIENLSEILKFADVVNVIDNSTEKAELLLSLKNNCFTIYKSRIWSDERIRKLIVGII